MTSQLPSVHDFVEQYRAAFEAACVNCGSERPQTSAAYQKIFDVENRTDDMVEAQIILEKERLLWEISRVGALEPLCETLKRMDPLYLATTAKLIGQIQVYNAVSGDEELAYCMDIQEPRDLQAISKYIALMNITICLALELIGYISGKNDVYEWSNDNQAKTGLAAMKIHGNNIKTLLDYLKENMDITFDDILSNEGINIWLLNPRNIDEFGRQKKAMNPQNFDVFKDVIENEILPGLSPKEALLRETDRYFYYDI